MGAGSAPAAARSKNRARSGLTSTSCEKWCVATLNAGHRERVKL